VPDVARAFGPVLRNLLSVCVIAGAASKLVFNGLGEISATRFKRICQDWLSLCDCKRSVKFLLNIRFSSLRALFTKCPGKPLRALTLDTPDCSISNIEHEFPKI
jgi:hypothetical protein